MKRFDRVSSILILLQTRRYITSGDMATRFEVSQRTIYRDLQTLEQAGIPIGAEPGKGYYLAEGYHLPPVMFTTDEAGALLMAEKMMEKFSDLSAQQCFKSAFDKIRSVLPQTDKEHVNHLNNSIEVYQTPSIAGEECGNRFLTDLQKAIGKKESIKIGYSAFYSGEKTNEREIEPIGLCFYSLHWHLIAWCKLRQEYRDFRIDRIRSLSHTGNSIEQKHVVTMKSYFMSLCHKEELQKVTITVDHPTAVMMESTCQYYGYLESETTKQGITMHFVTADYIYIARWLMMFIDGIQQVEPVEMVEAIENLIHSIKFKIPQHC